MLASGVDPALSPELPWVPRHAAARASAAELVELLEDNAGDDADAAFGDERFTQDPVTRVRAAQGSVGLGSAL